MLRLIESRPCLKGRDFDCVVQNIILTFLFLCLFIKNWDSNLIMLKYCIKGTYYFKSKEIPTRGKDQIKTIGNCNCVYY